MLKKTSCQNTWQKKSASVLVFTGGVFDLFHYGHLESLKRCKAMGDKLVVGLLTDKAATSYKRKPIIPYEERKVILEGLKCVDMVIPKTRNETKLLDYLQPDIVMKGVHMEGDPLGIDGGYVEKWVEKNNKRLIYVPYIEEQSATKIIQKIYDQRG